jgi:hypothetical protein
MRGAATPVLALLLAAGPAAAARPESVPELARRIAGETGSTAERTRRLVDWMQENLEWTWTDYRDRTPEDVLQRRAGNCAELASVLETLLTAIAVPSRWVAEVNLQPSSAQRQTDAEAKVREYGSRASVFGRAHNDHRWLEVRDAATGAWFPADPAVGVVGIREWEAARLSFGNRPPPPVPAVGEITRDMIAPIAVTSMASHRGKPAEDRSEHYLVEEFDRFYGGRLSALPGWKDWADGVREMSRAARAAFAGDEDLHRQAARIDALRNTYERLAAQFSERDSGPAERIGAAERFPR